MSSIDRETEKTLFDIATHSLDFGSGFLDDEEVEALRRYAVYLGTDPMEATPHNHKPKYCPGHEWHQPWIDNMWSNPNWRCKHCQKTPHPDEWAPQAEAEKAIEQDLADRRKKREDYEKGPISGWGKPLPNSSPEPPKPSDTTK